ncbi:hypothetical protein ACJX0J_007665, partial [Zea mays]
PQTENSIIHVRNHMTHSKISVYGAYLYGVLVTSLIENCDIFSLYGAKCLNINKDVMYLRLYKNNSSNVQLHMILQGQERVYGPIAGTPFLGARQYDLHIKCLWVEFL